MRKVSTTTKSDLGAGRRGALRQTERIVLERLTAFDANGNTVPGPVLSVNGIAQGAGLIEKTVEHAVTELKERGYVEYRRESRKYGPLWQATESGCVALRAAGLDTGRSREAR